ncbi:MAG TPA: ribosomal protein S18-alanine N-acetyltransferase [Terriglobales bacterium]|nr:ribosomal protein S18-alanine N-acetyltransferase [Terriglobales bacterium]
MSRVRAATLDDIRMLMAIEEDSPTAAHWQEGQYRAALEPGATPERVSLVVEAETVLGFIVARVLGDEWEIENLAVAGPAQRRGLGSQLVGGLLDMAKMRSARSVFLEVRESNRVARRLYEKWGFVAAGRRKSYYADPPEDGLLFRHKFSTTTLKRG